MKDRSEVAQARVARVRATPIAAISAGITILLVFPAAPSEAATAIWDDNRIYATAYKQSGYFAGVYAADVPAGQYARVEWMSGGGTWHADGIQTKSGSGPWGGNVYHEAGF